MNTFTSGKSFRAISNQIHRRFLQKARKVHTDTWQGSDISKRPEARMRELLNVEIHLQLEGEEDLDPWRNDISPNLPWADKHFEERVCGYPINPGIEWENWPWNNSAKDFLIDGQFNHNYMERYWPKYAGHNTASTRPSEYGMLGGTPHRGIRQTYGDLSDLVSLLVSDPLTRQAWLPIFFPEDTGFNLGARKPCTLGYQFMVRDEELHIYYPLRSCDFFRHWADDVYLTIRLAIWVLEQCRDIDPVYWDKVKLGSYSMHCTSLHVFENDFYQMGGKP